MADRLTVPLQESILALLATNQDKGRLAATLLTAEVFDDSYQDFAHRILSYIKNHNKVPGKAHLDDLCDDILNNPKHKKHAHYVNIITGILSLADSGLNPDYLISRINDFTRRQNLKGAVLAAAERYQNDNESMVTDVEGILYGALKNRVAQSDTGVFLSDTSRALNFLVNPAVAYKTGIPAFDARNMGPTPGQMLLFMAATGYGKSWMCVDTAKRCLMQGAKVLYISLEMSIDEVMERIFMNFFALSSRKESFNVNEFVFDRQGNLKDLKIHERHAKMTLDSPKIEGYLRNRITRWGARFSNLIVQDFPASHLDMGRLENYLDELMLAHQFVPHVLILDYPDKMKLNRNDLRLSLAATYTQLSGLLKDRNLAGVFPTQTNRRGWDATTVKSSMVGEDATKIMIANKVIVFSRTAEEYARGLARMFVAKNRGDEDKFTVLITQSYKSGQFVLDSTRLTQSYQQYRELMGLVEDSEEDE